MALPPLIGEHELSIDEKNRLLIPAQWRRALDAADAGGSFVVMTGTNRRPWLYPEPAYNQLVQQVQRAGLPTEEQHRLQLMVFAKAAPLSVDKQGRVLLPEKILRRTQTGKEVSLLGMGDHMEVWNRSDWELMDEELTPQMAPIAAAVRSGEALSR